MDGGPTEDKHLIPVSKGLVMTNLNICSIRNKVHELNYLITDNTIHVLAVSETHVHAAVLDMEICIDS